MVENHSLVNKAAFVDQRYPVMPTRSAGMWRSPNADRLRMIRTISLVPKKWAQRCGQLIEEVQNAPVSLACTSMLKKSA
jgi:hypothetical protein